MKLLFIPSSNDKGLNPKSLVRLHRKTPCLQFSRRTCSALMENRLYSLPASSTGQGIFGWSKCISGAGASRGRKKAAGIRRQAAAEGVRLRGMRVMKKFKVKVPADFAKALAAHPAAEAKFGKMPPSHQREYVGAILEAKKPETRIRRIAAAIEMIVAWER